MRLGATLVHLSDAPPFRVAPWAQRLVAAGFESLWTPHIVGRGTLVPDPFTTLAVGGRGHPATSSWGPPPCSCRSCTLSTSPTGRSASWRECGDRLTLGVSPGSTEADYLAFDREYAARFRTFRQHADRLRVLLTDGRDDGAELAPAPARRPALLLGSWGAGVERAARDFDGWLASGYRSTPDEIVAAHERYRAAGGRRAVVCAIPVVDDDAPRHRARVTCAGTRARASTTPSCSSRPAGRPRSGCGRSCPDKRSHRPGAAGTVAPRRGPAAARPSFGVAPAG